MANKPLGRESDAKPIHEVVRHLMQQAHVARMAPVGLVFSPEGRRMAESQTVPGMDPWNNRRDRATHYLGLPFEVDHKQASPVTLRLVPGGSAEAQEFRARQRAVRLAVGGFAREASSPLRVSQRTLDSKPGLELIAEQLTAPQLCDVIERWYGINPDTELGQALHDAVVRHGRSE